MNDKRSELFTVSHGDKQNGVRRGGCNLNWVDLMEKVPFWRKLRGMRVSAMGLSGEKAS